jgi:hypothetical protein
MLPDGYHNGGITQDPNKLINLSPVEKMSYKIVTQSDFLREYDPNGHIINDRDYYPDVWRKNPEDGRWYIEYVPRYAFAYQAVLMVKQLTHLCANDIQFELLDTKQNEKKNDLFMKFRLGWLKKNMEIAWYEVAKSVKKTGDGAFVGYLRNGEFGWTVYSYAKGDKIYPHFDPITGELYLFAREYTDMDEKGAAVISWIEVWDKTNYYRMRRDEAGTIDKIANSIKGLFGQSGYRIVESKPHGFGFIPVAYFRDDNGACWSLSQECIDNYEMAFSRLAQNNHAFGTPIMYLKGEGVEVIGDENNAVKTILIPEDGEAGFLNRQDASNSYATELNKLEDMIYSLSHAVKNIELKSGDTPSSSIKLLFHTAIEKATIDAQEYQPLIDQMVKIFSFGYGTEEECELDFRSLSYNVWIEPYIPQNVSELVTNLATGVQNKFISKRTASMRASVYTTNDELERILKEIKEEQQDDVLANLQQSYGQQVINSEVQNEGEVVTPMNQLEDIVDPDKANDTPTKKKDGYKGELNTGGRGRKSGSKGGRPNRSGKIWNNGNYEGENNWDDFDRNR